MVAGLAEEQADGGVVIGCLDLGVHGGEVEVELAGVAGFEGVGLEFHDDMAFQPGVIEQEIHGIPFACGGIGNVRQQANHVEPGQLVSRLLTNSQVGIGLGEKPHVFQIRSGKPFHVRECLAEVREQALDDIGSPASAGGCLCQWNDRA